MSIRSRRYAGAGEWEQWQRIGEANPVPSLRESWNPGLRSGLPPSPPARELGLPFDPGDFTDAEAIAAVARITSGHFRLVQPLFEQIRRVRYLNQLNTITAKVVETARETLVVGA